MDGHGQHRIVSFGLAARTLSSFTSASSGLALADFVPEEGVDAAVGDLHGEPVSTSIPFVSTI